jgi:alpha-D-xyloside xylohydrolase
MGTVEKKGVFSQQKCRDFPKEPDCWQIDDQYMFGDDYIAAPILAAGQRSRVVYLPGAAAGAAAVTWQHVFTNETYAGGKNHTIAAPLDSFPLFKRVGGSGRTVIQGSAPAIDE